MRKGLFVLLLVALLLVSCGGQAVSVVPSTSGLYTYAYRMDGASRLYGDTIMSRGGYLPGQGDMFLSPPPVYASGRLLVLRDIYTSSGALTYEVAAYDVAGATLSWTYSWSIALPEGVDADDPVALSEVIYPPLFATDGENFYISQVYLERSGAFRLTAVRLSADGREVWKKTVADRRLDAKWAYPLAQAEVYGGRLLLLWDGVGIYAISLSDGSLAAHYDVDAVLKAPPTLGDGTDILADAREYWEREAGTPTPDMTYAVGRLMFGAPAFAATQRGIWLASVYGMGLMDRDTLRPVRFVPWDSLHLMSRSRMGDFPYRRHASSRVALFARIRGVYDDGHGVWVLALAPEDTPSARWEYWASAGWAFYPVLIRLDTGSGVFDSYAFGASVSDATMLPAEEGVYVEAIGRVVKPFYPGGANVWRYAIYRAGTDPDGDITISDIYATITDPQELKDLVGYVPVADFGGNTDVFWHVGSTGPSRYLPQFYADGDVILTAVKPMALLISHTGSGKIDNLHIFFPPGVEKDPAYTYSTEGARAHLLENIYWPFVACVSSGVGYTFGKEPWLEGGQVQFARDCFVEELTGYRSDATPFGALLYYDRQRDIGVYQFVYTGSQYDKRGIWVAFFKPSKLEATTLRHPMLGKPVSESRWHHISHWIQTHMPPLTFWSTSTLVGEDR